MTAKLDYDGFLSRARAVHGEKYSYSCDNFHDQYTVVTVTCKRHGEFEQVAKNHIRGSGCKKCGVDRVAGSRAIPYREFVRRSLEKHSLPHIYDQESYRTTSEPTKIVCTKHSCEFWQLPERHMKGQTGCAECSREKRVRKRTKTTAEFVRDAMSVHGDRYDYSKAEYTGAQRKLTIICSKHGEFTQLATNHLAGYGCAECATRKMFHELHFNGDECLQTGHVYVMKIVAGGQRLCKVGYAQCVNDRINRLQHEGVSVLSYIEYAAPKPLAFAVERDFHKNHRKMRAASPAMFGGYRECYPFEMHDRAAEIVSQAICGRVRES